MKPFLALAALLLSACAATTSVVLLDPTRQYPPSAAVEILLKPPQRDYVEIAKLESQGNVGEPETAVLEEARQRARSIGADAIIVVDSSSIYQPPVILHDPWPPHLPWYHDRWHGYRYWYYPPPFPYYFEPRTLPGGHAYTIRALAIRYR